MDERDRPPYAPRDIKPLPQGEAPGSAPTPAPPPSILGPALWFYGAMLALAWVICWWTDSSPFVASGTAGVEGARWLWNGATGAVAGALIIALSDQLTRRTQAGAALADALAALLGPLSVADCVILALASGLAEEAFFRGMLQPHIGLVAASVVFGIAHFVPRRELALWSLFAAAAGLLFGVLYESTGNLIAPVVAHATVNAVNLVLLSRRPSAKRAP